MKIDKKFKLREIAGETIIVNQGDMGADLTKIISLNSTSRFLYEQLSNKDFTLEDVEKLLKDNYEVDDETVRKDAADWIEQLKKCKILAE